MLRTLCQEDPPQENVPSQLLPSSYCTCFKSIKDNDDGDLGVVAYYVGHRDAPVYGLGPSDLYWVEARVSSGS